ncbi:MAG: hypothetical protein WBG70_03070 [Spirulinaceae cyanobacterium]
MNNNSRSLRISVTVGASQPELLQGLDVWLNLGLISELQVNKIAREYLSCRLPTPSNVTVSQPEPVAVAEFASPPEPRRVREPQLSRVPGIPFFSRLGQSFKDELSVRWLLFLGVFLVVMSSGVLAATQWSRFPSVGQYGVLFTYTLVFWIVGFWAKQQDNLQLTAQTLASIALLLIPLNFWAMDSFGLWQNTIGLITVGIAVVGLVGIAWQHDTSSKLQSVAFLSLSLLHWGWQVPTFSLAAVYLATIGTTIIFRWQRSSITPPLLVYALGVILARAIFIEQLPLETLGLAVGICGWLLATEGLQADTTQKQIWQVIGVILLFFSWSVAVEQTSYWQALLVSGLSIWFFSRRLQLYWQRRDLGVLFILGLQSLLLIWELVPPLWQATIVTPLLQLTALQTSPEALLSISLFPYLILFTTFSDWLYHRDKLNVARFGNFLSLLLGIALTLISCLNPYLRSLNLLLSTFTLAFVTQRRQTLNAYLVCFTHLIGLLALASSLDSFFPNLPEQHWALILLLLMVGEWIFSTRNASIYQQSAWYFGFLLASISYILLTSTLPLEINQRWQLIWLLTPLTLTFIADTTQPPRQTQAASFSVASLILVQLLTFWQPETRIISLGFAVGLMYLNARYLSSFLAVIIHLGFILTFIATILWQFTTSPPTWLLASGIATIIFWLGQGFLQQRQGNLAAIYAKAADSWGIFLWGLNLSLLTVHSLTIYAPISTPRWQYPTVAALMLIAITGRYWQQAKDINIYSLIWAVEILMAEIILLNNGSALHLAIANIILAPLTLAATAPLSKSSPSLPVAASPLIYALIGTCLRLPYFNAYTGFLTLGAALTGIGVSHRRQGWKYIAYLSLAGISLAWYELVIYQLSQAPAGNPADGYTILAIVAVVIAFCYRFLAWWGQNKPHIFNLEVKEIQTTANIHWFIGTFLMVIGASYSVNSPPNLKIAAVGVSLSLVGYALEQGRNASNIAKTWVYGGLIELGATALSIRVLWPQLHIFDNWMVFIACLVAALLYELPWGSWGWPTQPWLHSAFALPLLTIIPNLLQVSYGSLLCAAAFYGWIAKRQQNLSWTYLSLILVDWGIARWLTTQQLNDPLWYATVIGLSILYIAQFNRQKTQRHHLRLIGTSLIAVVAVVFHQETGLIPGIMGLTVTLLGLGLKIRAFLWVGTITFLITVSYQLIILALTYSFLKWIFGIIVGIILIAVAANFEQRREQAFSLWQNWSTRFEEWQ